MERSTDQLKRFERIVRATRTYQKEYFKARIFILKIITAQIIQKSIMGHHFNKRP